MICEPGVITFFLNHPCNIRYWPHKGVHVKRARGGSRLVRATSATSLKAVAAGIHLTSLCAFDYIVSFVLRHSPADLRTASCRQKWAGFLGVTASAREASLFHGETKKGARVRPLPDARVCLYICVCIYVCICRYTIRKQRCVSPGPFLPQERSLLVYTVERYTVFSLLQGLCIQARIRSRMKRIHRRQWARSEREEPRWLSFSLATIPREALTNSEAGET